MAASVNDLSWHSAGASTSGLARGYSNGVAALRYLVAIIAFLPVWLPGLLQVGNFSFAFSVPFILALWALFQPASPGSFQGALVAQQGRGLWMEFLCAVAIAMLAALTTLFSPEPLNAFRVILPMSYGICTMILMSRISKLAVVRAVFAVLFSGVLALAVGLVLAQSGWGHEELMRDYRFFGFFENANQLGIMLVAVWPLAVALLLNARTVRARAVALAIVAVLALAILMSGTKTALALCFASTAVIWLYHSGRSGTLAATLVRIAIVLSVLIVAVPLLLWLLSWAAPAFFARVDNILTNGVWAFPSMQARGQIWKDSLQTGLANPLLGAGAGTEIDGYAHSHNMLLDYFRGMGLGAVLAAIALILSAAFRVANFLVSTLHKRDVDRASDTIVAGMYVGAIFHLIANQLSDSFSPTTAFLFWMMYCGAFFSARRGARSVVQPAHPSTVGWSPRARTATGPATLPV